MKKDVVAGLGETGLPILKLISKKEIVVGYDLDKNLMNPKKFTKLKIIQLVFYTLLYLSQKNLIPILFHYMKNFYQNVLLYIVQSVLELPINYKIN